MFSKTTDSKEIMTSDVARVLAKDQNRKEQGEMLKTCCYQSLTFALCFVKLYFISLL